MPGQNVYICSPKHNIIPRTWTAAVLFMITQNCELPQCLSKQKGSINCGIFAQWDPACPWDAGPTAGPKNTNWRCKHTIERKRAGMEGCLLQGYKLNKKWTLCTWEITGRDWTGARGGFADVASVLLRNRIGPGWCGSVDWALAWESKGWWLDSQFRAHSWVAGLVPSVGCARGNHTWMFLSLSSSLPSLL